MGFASCDLACLGAGLGLDGDCARDCPGAALGIVGTAADGMAASYAGGRVPPVFSCPVNTPGIMPVGATWGTWFCSGVAEGAVSGATLGGIMLLDKAGGFCGVSGTVAGTGGCIGVA